MLGARARLLVGTTGEAGEAVHEHQLGEVDDGCAQDLETLEEFFSA